MSGKVVRILAVAAFCQMLFPRDAQAYLDPGTGSLIFQMVVAAVVGIAVALRLYWQQIKAFFARRSDESHTDSGASTTDDRRSS